MKEWMAGACAPMFQQDVLRPGAGVGTIIDTTYARQLFEAHRAGRANHGQVLWTVWMLARWYEAASRSDRAMPALVARPVRATA